MKKLLLLLISLFLVACSSSGWKLTSGTDTDPLIYEGNVELTGWLVHGPSFADSWEDRKGGALYFMVTDESGVNLPQDIDFSGYDNLFLLENYNKTQASQLEYSSRQKPAQVLAKKITTHGKSFPTMELKKVLKTSNKVTDENGWKLTYGLEPSPDPWSLVYEGWVQLEGWIVDVPSYVGPETSPHFHVAESSQNSLPQHEYTRYDFYLSEETHGELIEELRQYNEENPAKVLVRKITFVMEGSPWMEIERFLNK